MITIYDYLIIGFYLVFMLAIGIVFRRMSKDTSDYFRAALATSVRDAACADRTRELANSFLASLK